jgi:hypothetical protein
MGRHTSMKHILMNLSPDPVPSILASISNLKADLYAIEIAVHGYLIPQADRISELENLVNPYSSSGQAICNYYKEDDHEQL